MEELLDENKKMRNFFQFLPHITVSTFYVLTLFSYCTKPAWIKFEDKKFESLIILNKLGMI